MAAAGWVRTTLSFNLHAIALADLRGAAVVDRTWFEALCAKLFFLMILRKAVSLPKTPGAFSGINYKPTKVNGKLLDKIHYEKRF